MLLGTGQAQRSASCLFCSIVFSLLSLVATGDHQITPFSAGGIAAALESAAPGDVLNLAAGTYTGPGNCGIEMTKPLSIVGEGAESTVLDCENSGSRCLTVYGNASGSVLRRVAFKNGGGVDSSGLASAASNTLAVEHEGDARSEAAKRKATDRTAHNSTRASSTYLKTMAKKLAGLRTSDLERLFLYWIRMSGVPAVISGLPDTVLRHDLLAQKVDATRAESADVVASVAETQHTAVERSEDCQVLTPTEKCSGTVSLTSPCGSMSSSPEDDTYPDLADCYWIFNPPGVSQLLISFTLLEVETSSSGCTDLLILSEGPESQQLGTFCGDSLDELHCSGKCASQNLRALQVSTPFTIRLRSDDFTFLETGFSLDWEPVAALSGPVLPFGGCVLVLDAITTFENVDFDGCTAKYGGGIGFNRSTGIFRDSHFRQNTAVTGGALFADSSVVRLDRSFFFENTAQSYNSQRCQVAPLGSLPVGPGGAALVALHGSTSIRSSLFISNRVPSFWCETFGGGLAVMGGTLDIYNSTLRNNSLVQSRREKPAFGGGLYSIAATVSLSSSSLVHHRASMGGGAFFKRSNVTIHSCLVSNNNVRAQLPTAYDSFQGGRGGGVSAESSALWIQSSIICHNNILLETDASDLVVSDGYGGGLFARASHLVVNSSRICHNIVNQALDSQGGGMFLERVTLQLVSSMVSSNVLNRGESGKGGGVFLQLCNATLTSSALGDNYVDSDIAMGGGVFVDDGGWVAPQSLNVTRSTISNNTLIGDDRALGGGIFFAGSTLSISDSRICHNALLAKRRNYPMGGSGIYARATNMSLHHSQVNHNRATVGVLFTTQSRKQTAVGAGIFVDYCLTSISSSEINYNSIVTQLRGLPSTSHQSKGTAMFISHGSVHVTNSSFSANVVRLGSGRSQGGAVFVQPGNTVSFTSPWERGRVGVQVSFSAVSTFFDSNILDSDIRAEGGAISVNGEGVLHLTACSVSYNALFSKVAVLGGAIELLSGANMTLAKSNIGNNYVNSSASNSFVEACRGGAIHSKRSVGTILSSWISRNRVYCPHARARGGAVDVELGHMWMVNSTLIFNKLSAVHGRGGSVHAFQTEIRFVALNVSQNMVIGGTTLAAGISLDETQAQLFFVDMRSNSLVGTSSAIGGALAMVGGSAHLSHVYAGYNRADEGAGLVFRGAAFVVADSILVVNNWARGLGGAITLRDSVQFVMAHSQLLDNRALLVSSIFGAGLGIEVTLFNCTLRADSEFHALLQGRRFELHNQTDWTTQEAGAAYFETRSNSTQMVRFVICPPGAYLLRESSSDKPRQCTPCPPGASCAGGTAVSAVRSHWGWVTGDLLTMARCPQGYCCPDQHCAPYDFCSGNRDGFLCGVCAAGFSETLGAPGCAHNSACTHLAWEIPLLLAVTGLGVFAFLSRNRRKAQAIFRTLRFQEPLPPLGDQGERKVILFFFQLLPLMITPESQEGVSQILQILFSFMNLNISNGFGGSGEGSSWCPYPGFSTTQKIMSRFVLPVFCVGWLGVFYLAETAVRLTRVKHNHADGHANYCGFGAHIATFFAVFGVAYSSLLQGTFQLVACVQLPDRLVLFLNATVECFQPWQMAVLGIVAPVFAMWPAFLAWFVFHVRRKKRRAEKKPSVAEEAVLMVIASPYDTSRRISQRWEAVLMLQRLVFVVISMFLIDSLWRAWTLVAILLPMLVAQMLVRPFKRQPCNVLMATCLSSLIGIGAWEVGLSVFSAYGLTSEHVQEFSTILMFLTLIPLIAGVCLYLHAPLLRLWSALGLRSRRKTDDGSTLLHAAQDVEGVELAQTWDPEITEADADDSVVC